MVEHEKRAINQAMGCSDVSKLYLFFHLRSWTFFIKIILLGCWNGQLKNLATIFDFAVLSCWIIYDPSEDQVFY